MVSLIPRGSSSLYRISLQMFRRIDLCDNRIRFRSINMTSRRMIIRDPRQNEPVVWVVDSKQWPRACLRAELIERGYDPYGFIAITDALDSYSNGVSPKPEVLSLEFRGQNLTQQVVESIRHLGIPTILLGGNAELSDPLVRERKWDMVLKRSFSLGTIADLVETLVPHLGIRVRNRA